MNTQVNGTRQAILDAGKNEFMKYGYEGASLRRIAKEASVTTGAIYGYFPGKEALFDALVGDAADGLLDMYRRVHSEFAELSPEKQAEALEWITDESVPEMVDYVYDRFDLFQLLFLKSGPGYCDDFLNQLTEIEEQSSWEFINAMKGLGHEVMDVDETLIHIISRSFLRQLWEFVEHQVPREKAVSYSLVLGQFQHAGWKKIMGI
ncbi:TetR/AcrR family transcriptional regulator [Clostridium sp. HBUAS56010]|uniref:TetR/AcrR family transcriptional regulator n=1 Tax=Clostridium sp. HBUAS56010 TaxID=2571127 RepID=UPI0011780FF2|nr:TetR/AcrR family transcriptional regulator [Clostridium sp. HBUAS56010]